MNFGELLFALNYDPLKNEIKKVYIYICTFIYTLYIFFIAHF